MSGDIGLFVGKFPAAVRARKTRHAVTAIEVAGTGGLEIAEEKVAPFGVRGPGKRG